MAFTFSFTSGEIVTPGTILKAFSPRPFNHSLPERSIGFSSASTDLTDRVVYKHSVIHISTEGLSSDRYNICIYPIQDHNDEFINKYPISVTIRVCELFGPVPNNLRIEHLVHLAVGELSTTRLRIGQEAPKGTQRIQVVKAVNRETHMPLTLTFNSNGDEVGSQDLLNAVLKRRAEKFGCIHETLWNRLAKAKDDDVINVVIWPRFDFDHTNYIKPKHISSYQTAGAQPRSRKVFETSKTKIITSLQQLEAEHHEDTDHPHIATSLTPEQIRELARSRHVAKIFLHEDRAIPNVSTPSSFKTSRAVRALFLGVGGDQVKVAVFEPGPSDTTALKFVDRHVPSPTDDPQYPWHSRMVSAIIQNFELDPTIPDGYAPLCQLYSANTRDNAALKWAVSEKQCTVINQSFTRIEAGEDTSPELSEDDLLKDWLATRDPFPTILQAGGNDDLSAAPGVEYVNHKGFNSVKVGSHNPDGTDISSWSVYRNPHSTNGDRELPEICANGEAVAILDRVVSGTSFATPAVAGTVALMQEADKKLQHWPEACRAILFASAGRNMRGNTWWNDVSAVPKVDAADGAGALDSEAAVKISMNYCRRYAPASISGWGHGTLQPIDINPLDLLSIFRYNVQVPPTFSRFVGSGDPTGLNLRVALAWNSKAGLDAADRPHSSQLTVNLDLVLIDRATNTQVAFSSSLDNNYEIIDFFPQIGAIYEIAVRRTANNDDVVWYGVAWCLFKGNPQRQSC